MNQMICSSLNVNGIEKESITSIEQLPNEIFYEFSHYLDGYDLYYAFSNLNIRFENLLKHSSLFFKIKYLHKSNSPSYDNYKEFIHKYKHKIVSLYFSDHLPLYQFIQLSTIDLSFTNLQSIIFHEILMSKFTVLLFYLKSLPCLFSLTVYPYCVDNDLADIYHMIFQLKFLKYFQMKIDNDETFNIDMSIINNKEFSTIKYFIIYHSISLDELIDLLFYTPQLIHLSCFGIIDRYDDIKPKKIIKLNNLQHLTISIYHLNFDKFENFIVKLSSQLIMLSVKINRPNKSYLNGARWEHFISQHMLYLKKFIFYHIDVIDDDDFKITPVDELISNFTSSFWSMKNWFLYIIIHDNELRYLVCPYNHSGNSSLTTRQDTITTFGFDDKNNAPAQSPSESLLIDSDNSSKIIIRK
ncbi:unnamed protein product [Rotaria sordida]|uniref:F-box domain-containing protein n=2 Tax=Rotaria sordida TaxID=392033 RepID=A0A815P0Q0_9BILA|nr:unnamed protein product [Rotaria sordida]